MSGAKSAVEKYCDELKIADAVARSLVGNHAATSRPFPGNAGANANPVRSSSANKTANAIGPWTNLTKPMLKIKPDHSRMENP